MMIFAVFIVLVSTVYCGQDCLSCTGVETSQDCDRHETCTNDEVCFKQKYSKLSGKTLFDFGCSMSQHSVGTTFGRRADGHHILCEASCNSTPLCNGKLQCDPAIRQNNTHLPRECAEIMTPNLKNGIYNIYPFDSPLAVYCDMTTENKRWTIIQRRYNGSVDFYRNWLAYKEGFGLVNGEYWLGHILDHPLNSHNGMQFSTFDHDVDNYNDNCAALFKGGWWYASCHAANLNGRYLGGHHESYADGIDVYTWRVSHYSLKTVTMMITKNNL